MDHIGIDVHQRESQIYILAESGEVIERRLRTEPEHFAAVPGTRPRARIVIEASTVSEWVARSLEALGHEVIVADPNFAPMYGTRSRKVKTDRRDARALAEAYLLGAYRPAIASPIPSATCGAASGSATPSSTRAPAISPSSAPCSASTAIASPPAVPSILFTGSTASLPGRLRSVVAPLLALMRPLNGQLTYSDATIEHLAVQDPRVRRLRSVPSIGPVTAAAFLAAIDDAQRFPHAHKLEAYLGLVPGERNSGETQRRGSITKGHSRPRWLLIRLGDAPP
jgi:transposase